MTCMRHFDCTRDLMPKRSSRHIISTIQMWNEGNLEAEKKFQDVQQAYEVLKDDKKRAMYDQVGHEAYEQATAGGAYEGSPFTGGGGFGSFSGTVFGDAFGGGMDEIFKSMFGDQVAVHQNVPMGVVFLLEPDCRHVLLVVESAGSEIFFYLEHWLSGLVFDGNDF
ncbi:unnamed protein product [Sphagnum troendelagicum]|uniref:J domain-containing protein n=1 Tax=Sphagnum troendelagicum TaxID=128251 RepID=A0ABP0U1E0_9BRYO